MKHYDAEFETLDEARDWFYENELDDFNYEKAILYYFENESNLNIVDVFLMRDDEKEEIQEEIIDSFFDRWVHESYIWVQELHEGEDRYEDDWD